METVHDFFAGIDETFDWDSYIAPPQLEEAFQDVLSQNLQDDDSVEVLKESTSLANTPITPSVGRKLPCNQEVFKKNMPLTGKRSLPPVDKKPSTSKRFAPSLDNAKIQELSTPFLLKNTKLSTEWAVRNFKDWIKSHNSSTSDQCAGDLLETSSDPKELSQWFSVYVLVTRKTDGKKVHSENDYVFTGRD